VANQVEFNSEIVRYLAWQNSDSSQRLMSAS